MFRFKTNQRDNPVGARRRTGSVILEFILAFPIILILSLAIIEFGFFALLQQTTTAATIEGSREAAQVGSTSLTVGNLIQEYLAINSLTLIVAPAAPGAGDVLVVIQEGGDLPAQTTSLGNSSIPCTPVGPAPSPAEVKVTVCLNLTDTNGTFPLPNLLSSFGFTLSGKQLEISAMTGLE
ncbi:TadE/TadG family type IV pilus assembly protein [Gimesia fumaroli]|uniref:TadE-like protein n=1 Tax=Gimesia fumaroli TaxID=2527976 RepID=A0A518I8T7_9PLAN|nr:TadE/TadG family type IV pilus assembly protein [Gimesia fumaroli]QDV49474.1 TadE-like protein [Gimesia fumaroli]